jgi:hypothetical protein
LLVDTSNAPGEGIVSESIQYKGIADNYTLSDAVPVAELYSDASTATGNPAVSTRSVGVNGGTAAAFTYDLAKSVIALHQGNQAWAGDNRDGAAPVRSNDMFFGAKTGNIQPDWVDLNKIHIPQADEQQRLLANVITEAAKDRKPLPRFWYLPYGREAAMVMAGDDHGMSNANGEESVFAKFLNESPTNCVLEKWECIRGSDYNYTAAAMTPTRSLQLHNLGFEMASHPPDGSGCADFASFSQLQTQMEISLDTWRLKYTSSPNQRSARWHCYVWSDWDSMPRVSHENGIRYDLNYVTYPSSWVGTRPALITGSGMNMRFIDADGDMLDVHQGVTNFENTVTGATAVNTVLSRATGAEGYYGIFGTHYDMTDTYHSTLFAAAQANDVPIISSDQALTWLDGRNSSAFTDVSGSDGRFTFGIEAGTGAQGLKAMMPIKDAEGTLSSITLDGGAVSYQSQEVKGVQYAVFDGAPGSYVATYSDYDPNAGSSGNGSGSSTSSGSPKKRTITAQNTADSAVADEAPADDEVNLTTTSPEETEEQVENNGQTAKAGGGVSWVLWLVIILLILAGLGTWLFFWLRRRRENRQITW